MSGGMRCSSLPLIPLGTDQNALEQSRKIVFDVADCIIPGHGKPFPNPQNPEASCAMVMRI
ncbi:MAG: hypothetical protein AAF298_07170 [Cyanobacteria bacterium P01_A01_bin.40]